MAKHRLRGDNIPVSTMAMIGIGSLFGIVADAVWYSVGLPGRNTPVNGCPAIKEADMLQFGGTILLTVIGFMTGSKVLPAFTFGIMAGLMVPKLFAPYFHAPRYLILDFDPTTGNITPGANRLKL